MAKSLSQQLLAGSVFATKPDTKLATLDVYDKTNRVIVNKIQDIAKKFDPDLMNILKGGDFIMKNFPVIENKVNNLIQVNKENLVARISGLTRDVANSVKSATGSFFEGVNSLGISTDMMVKVGALTSQVYNTDFSDLQSVGRFVNTVARSDVITIEDKDSLAALSIGVIKEATAHGIPNSFGAIVNTIEDSVVLNKIITNVVPFSIDTSDVRMLQSIVEADKTNLTRLLEQETVDKFIYKYSYGLGFNENQQKEEYRMMTEQFDSIDDLWNKKIVKERGQDKEIISLRKVLGASQDFVEGMILDVKDTAVAAGEKAYMALGSLFKKTTVEDEINKLLPYHYKTDTALNSPNPVDPQILST